LYETHLILTASLLGPVPQKHSL